VTRFSTIGTESVRIGANWYRSWILTIFLVIRPPEVIVTLSDSSYHSTMVLVDELLEGDQQMVDKKTLDVSDTSDAQQKISDVKVVGNPDVFIPFNQIHTDSEVWQEGGDPGELVVMEWLANERSWL